MKAKRFQLAVFVAVAIAVSYCAFVSFRQSQLAGQVLRLRILAHDNDMASQSQKLLVRDKVLAFCDDHKLDFRNAEEAISFIKANMKTIQAEIASIAGDKPFCILLKECHYPTRSYRSFSLPAGRYIGMQIYLDGANGKNWWCVLYPSLCTEDTAESRYDQTTFSFKCAEWVDKICNFLWS